MIFGLFRTNWIATGHSFVVLLAFCFIYLKRFKRKKEAVYIFVLLRTPTSRTWTGSRCEAQAENFARCLSIAQAWFWLLLVLHVLVWSSFGEACVSYTPPSNFFVVAVFFVFLPGRWNTCWAAAKNSREKDKRYKEVAGRAAAATLVFGADNDAQQPQMEL